LLARHGDTSNKAGAKAGQQENNDIQQSTKSGESSSEHAAPDEPQGERALPITALAASLEQSSSRSHAGVKKPHNKVPEEAESQLIKRHAAPARGRINATSGSASHGQDQLTSAARYRRVRATLQEALLPRFDYPSVARRRGWQGRVSIGLHVEADGDLTRIQLLESSGYVLLDKAVVRNVAELRNVPAAIQ